MNIGILAPPLDAQAAALERALAEQGTTARMLELRDEASVVMGDEALGWDGHDLLAFDVVYVHGFRYTDPVLPRHVEEMEWALWQAHYLVDQQGFSTRYSILSELVRRGGALVNPVDAHLHDFMKGTALRRLGRAGIGVPSLLCSNDEQRVEAFCARPGKNLWRPATGRAAWQLFLDKQREHLVTPHSPPILVTKAIEGPLVRCWLYDDEPLLCLQHAAPDPEGLERLELFGGIDRDEMRTQRLRGICASLGARWLQLTYVLADGDTPMVLDFDCDPLLDWLPRAYRDYLLRSLAARLVGQPAPADAPTEAAERPTLFLRRMLRDLWEYEGSKYE